ncbi:unnamed protein product [Linum tenue]|uniref:Uncharacterized protein n=1 Tax=Linum tenue TaxID=586396 RepID=A0AAV0IDS1_9ROSI|nr:unnamed protein product [Linum tenue]
MGSLKRKSRGTDYMEDERMQRRKKRRHMADLSHEGFPSKNGISGGSTAKTRTRTRGNLPNQGASNDHHYPPDDDYKFFLDSLGLGLPSAADSGDRVGGTSGCDSEAATRGMCSDLKGDWPDLDIDLFQLLAEKGGGSSSIRAEDDGVGNGGDPGATSGCGASMDGDNEAARYVDDSFLRACYSGDKNGMSCKDDTGDEATDDGCDDKSGDSFHGNSEFVEEAGEIGGSGDDDTSFDNVAPAEEVADHCRHFDLSDPGQTADDDILEASDLAYLSFLENLREDGTAYSVELPVSNGKSLSFVYEKQYVSRGQCDAGEPRQTSLQRKNGEPDICLGLRCDETQGHSQIGNEGGAGCDPRVPNGSNKSLLTGRKFSYKTENGVRSGFRREEKSQMEDLSERESKRKGEERGDSKVACARERRSCSALKPRIRDEAGDAPENACRTEAPMPARVQSKSGDTREKNVLVPSLVRDKTTETVPCRESKKKGEERGDPKVASGRERRSCSPLKPKIRDEKGDAPENAHSREAPMPARVKPKSGETRTEKVPVRKEEQKTKAQKDVSDMHDMKRRRLIPDRTQRKESLNPVPCEEPATTKMPSNKNEQCKPKVELDDMQDRKRRRLISAETLKKGSLNPVPCEEPATTKTPSNRNQCCRPKIDEDQIDKCYEIFLCSLKKKPTHIEFVPSVGERVLYHDYPTSYPTSPSDSDLMEIDAATFANDVNTPFVLAKNHGIIDLDLEPEEGHGGNHYNSVFRVKLLENLRKPYDRREYEELLKEVSCRKQMVKDRELRHGRTVEIKLEAFGQSYLDKYTDFARKLHELKADSECNRAVRLNLLRGFFYWLENLPLPGSFHPWLDESCLKVLPSSKLAPRN